MRCRTRAGQPQPPPHRRLYPQTGRFSRMARSRSNDLFSTLRSQGLRKRVAKALSELESGRKSASGRAEQLARQAIKALREAASEIEKRLGTAGSSSRSRAGKKAAATRKRS